jgi:hypothetical protein
MNNTTAQTVGARIRPRFPREVDSPIIVPSRAARIGRPPGKDPLQYSIAEAVTREHFRAVSEYKSGKDESASRRYRRILCAEPGDRIASLNLVWLATRLDLSSEIAARAGAWAICRFPDNPRLRFLTGRTLFWRGRISEAIPLLGGSVKDGPDPERAYSLLGEAVGLKRAVSGNPSLGGPVPPPPGSRLVAFTRDIISLDHLLPVIWRWSESGQGTAAARDAVIVFTGAMPATDWRITAARSMRGVHVRTLLDLATNLDIDAMLRDLLSEASGRLVVFDKTNDVTARVFGGAARRHGAAFVALPHGEEAFANKLTKTHETEMPAASRPDTGLYDLSVHSSDFTIVKYGLATGPRVAVLGSARYCRRWLRQVKYWVQPPEGLPMNQGLRLVLFLPKPEKIVDWRELERVLAFIARRPGITLVVKAHPRRGGRHRLVQRDGEWDYEVTETVEHELLAGIRASGPDSGWMSAPPDVESGALVAWADVILALGTSVTWEAVATNKPVLELSWCHGSRTTMAKFLPSTDLRCRDDLLDALGRIERDGPAGFYPPAERRAFITRFIEPDIDGDENAVLDGYVDTLEALAARATEPVPARGIA